MAFRDPPNTASLVCRHVLRGELPILFVSHDADDGGWQFLCNVHEHGDNDVAIVALHRAIDIDPEVNELGNMPLGFIATRVDQSRAWQIKPNPDSISSSN
jgi:hypothetical protein